ncbi:general substrate transporter [Decorospora gaudefroyi]|uniref:General substrate transporter n=1 Tax=Decorospora gaudefroyi TaxID=184978 RepID=A0A6A5K2V7_9PLEO|nr:general substrate transporter [Decorospora gaudefroyi]
MAPTTANRASNANLTFAQRLKFFNSMLFFIMIHMAFCAFNFGFDVGTFGGVQAMQSFADDFGEYNAEKDSWALAPSLRSVMVSTPFIGKALGAIVCGMIAERWGRRMAILVLCIVSFIGATLQTSATTAAQFTIGRIIAYAMTGMAVVVVPIYQAETAPPELRGMFGCTIQFMIIFGQVVASLITYGTQNITSNAGWQIPIGLQLVPPFLILVLLPILPESPRWLVSRDRNEDAAKSLRKIRKSASEEDIQFEIESWRFVNANEQHKGSWAEVFNKKNRLRTGIAVFAMFGQQITGQAFPTQYQVVFYQQEGLGANAFLYNVISNVVGLIAVIMTWFTVDGAGRRPTLLLGGAMMAAFMLILGGMGTVPVDSRTDSMGDMMVASFMLFNFFFNLSWAPLAYVIVSETAALRVKEKTNLLSMVVSVLTTFVTSFTTPYLINDDYAGLGGKLGYIYGAINVLVVVGVFFIVPELKGRSLEEVDQLFASGAPIRSFSKMETKNAEQLYEEGVAVGDKLGTVTIEHKEGR